MVSTGVTSSVNLAVLEILRINVEATMISIMHCNEGGADYDVDFMLFMTQHGRKFASNIER